MASRRTLIHRLFAAATASTPAQAPAAPIARRLLSGGGGRRCLQQSGGFAAERLGIPGGEGLMERLRAMGGGRIRLDGLVPPRPQPPDRAGEVEAARGRLRGAGEGSVSYERFVEMCGGEKGIARALDEGGDVLVLGNVVFLRPEQVTQAIQSIILPSLADATTTKTLQTQAAEDPRWSELEELETKQAAIDAQALAGVRRELWGGLAYLVAQTALFMRLTFWELSWDVMEPICYYVTSAYFMAGYAFFLRTSKDPSFEGFFESRFEARRNRLMKAEGFDPLRIQELRRALGLCHSSRRAPCGLGTRDLGKLGFHTRDCGCQNGLEWVVQ